MDPVQFRANWTRSQGPLPHPWEHTVGSCHAPLALRADWQGQLCRCRQELGFRHVRFHGLLNDDMSTLVGRKGQPVYSFFNADAIWDFVLSLGMRPFIELSFMPEFLASGSATVFHYRGNITPPKNYHQWATLIGKLAVHWVERYGLDEVRQWYFEVWNEPNLDVFWAGTRDDYFALYRHTALALKQVDSRLRVGGPATAKEEWIDEFLDYCEGQRLPVDFVSTHHYPNDVIWHDDQDTEGQLAQSRRSILREWTVATRRRARGLPLYYTEWNISSNGRYPPQDEPYAAAFVVKTVLEAADLVDGYSFWTFSDLFEENYFPSNPFHGGFGLLNLHGIPKPTYRAFELLHRLDGDRLEMEGQHPTVDAWAVRGPVTTILLLSNHALPRQPIQAEAVHVDFTGIPAPTAAYLERIDHDHANAKRAWQKLGSSEYLTARQVEQLAEASRLVREAMSFRYTEGLLELEVVLPPHAVAAITLTQ
jgi:xylan 1,4-beta-xylosidase